MISISICEWISFIVHSFLLLFFSLFMCLCVYVYVYGPSWSDSNKMEWNGYRAAAGLMTNVTWRLPAWLIVAQHWPMSTESIVLLTNYCLNKTSQKIVLLFSNIISTLQYTL